MRRRLMVPMSRPWRWHFVLILREPRRRVLLPPVRIRDRLHRDVRLLALRGVGRRKAHLLWRRRDERGPRRMRAQRGRGRARVVRAAVIPEFAERVQLVEVCWMKGVHRRQRWRRDDLRRLQMIIRMPNQPPSSAPSGPRPGWCAVSALIAAGRPPRRGRRGRKPPVPPAGKVCDLCGRESGAAVVSARGSGSFAAAVPRPVFGRRIHTTYTVQQSAKNIL